MQTSTPIEAHDPPPGPSADPIRDIGRLKLILSVIVFTVIGTAIFGHWGIQSSFVLSAAMLLSVLLRRILYRRYVGRPVLSVTLASGIAVAAAVVVWAVFLRPRG